LKIPLSATIWSIPSDATGFAVMTAMLNIEGLHWLGHGLENELPRFTDRLGGAHPLQRGCSGG
jgi:hypothetical protein